MVINFTYVALLLVTVSLIITISVASYSQIRRVRTRGGPLYPETKRAKHVVPVSVDVERDIKRDDVGEDDVILAGQVEESTNGLYRGGEKVAGFALDEGEIVFDESDGIHYIGHGDGRARSIGDDAIFPVGELRKRPVGGRGFIKRR